MTFRSYILGHKGLGALAPESCVDEGLEQVIDGLSGRRTESWRLLREGKKETIGKGSLVDKKGERPVFSGSPPVDS